MIAFIFLENEMKVLSLCVSPYGLLQQSMLNIMHMPNIIKYKINEQRQGIYFVEN
jgi:hypothetical protein